MTVNSGPLRYEWIENWAKIPVQTGWAHHGLAVASDGSIVTGGATRSEILLLNPDGDVQKTFSVPVTETHGLAISREMDQDILWIAATGDKVGVVAEYPPQILKCTLKGEVLAKLDQSDFDYADGELFNPTSLDVDSGTGKIWITDGYGSHRVHRFGADFKLELTLDGSTGAGRFGCPHGIHCRIRNGQTEIYIADRGNNRIQIFDTDGQFLRCLDDGWVTPSAFASFGDYLVVAELNARVVVLDQNDRMLGEIGEGRHYLMNKGWPNRLGSDGETISPLHDIEPGTFNSPHGIAADPDGNIYVSEWLIGDRYTKLKRLGE